MSLVSLYDPLLDDPVAVGAHCQGPEFSEGQAQQFTMILLTLPLTAWSLVPVLRYPNN
jgi:hypothetical protein